MCIGFESLGCLHGPGAGFVAPLCSKPESSGFRAWKILQALFVSASLAVWSLGRQTVSTREPKPQAMQLAREIVSKCGVFCGWGFGVAKSTSKKQCSARHPNCFHYGLPQRAQFRNLASTDTWDAGDTFRTLAHLDRIGSTQA